MKKLCPTCNGKGSIPDPKCIGIPMAYCGPNGERCPEVMCQSCNGSGWIEESFKWIDKKEWDFALRGNINEDN